METPAPVRALRHLALAFMEPKVRILFGMTVSVICTGAVFYHFVEGWGWLDSFYFSTVTLATVGYGDFAPATAPGKLFTIFYIMIGIGIFVALGAALADEILAQAARERRETARALRRSAVDGREEKD